MPVWLKGTVACLAAVHCGEMLLYMSILESFQKQGSAWDGTRTFHQQFLLVCKAGKSPAVLLHTCLVGLLAIGHAANAVTSVLPSTAVSGRSPFFAVAAAAMWFIMLSIAVRKVEAIEKWEAPGGEGAMMLQWLVTHGFQQAAAEVAALALIWLDFCS